MFKRILPFLLALCVPLVIATSAMAEFGLQKFAISARNKDGTPDTQAGSHPYAVTNTFVLNLNPGVGGIDGRQPQTGAPSEGDLKDVRLELPTGFVGDPNATPQCTYQVFVSLSSGGAGCSNETAVGVNTTYLGEAGTSRFTPEKSAVYNLVPPTGVAAEFAFMIARDVPVFLQTGVRTGGDYGLTTNVPDISQAAVIAATKVTIWGVPADPAHNDLRGRCLSESGGVYEEYYGGPNDPPFNVPDPESPQGLAEGEDEIEGPIGPVGANDPLASAGDCPTQTPVVPLLTNPTSCGTPRTATLAVDDWEEPGNFSGSRTKSASLPELSDCEKLDFSPTISVGTDGSGGSTPTGLNVEERVPQESTENPVGLAEADVKNTTVMLPEGVQLSPGAADGLQACSPSQIGLHTAERPTCPDASKVATVEVNTPVLPEPLTGAAYLATQDENPFGSLIALYVVAEDPVAGVLVKLAGQVSLDPVTGQIVATFENTPQLPYSRAKLDFFGTARAPLSTPASCGTYTTETSFEPWSGTPAVKPSSSFQIATGPNGSPCQDPRPFQPGFVGDTTNIQAGAYTPLAMTMTRPDADQPLGKLDVVFPPGISAGLQGVKLCEEPQAASGQCPAESQIGQVIASAGLGDDPYSVEDGKAYITGPYKGAPFGVDVVVPAVAGPFNLGTEVVRSKVDVDPTTAQLTVVSDPFPTILDGIPLQLQHINVTVNRPGFVFNPTSCEPMKLTGQLESSEGATANVSTPFQVTNCGSLTFKPQFSVQTSAKTSRTEGASLHVN